MNTTISARRGLGDTSFTLALGPLRAELSATSDDAPGGRRVASIGALLAGLVVGSCVGAMLARTS